MNILRYFYFKNFYEPAGKLIRKGRLWKLSAQVCFLPLAFLKRKL